MLGVTCNNERYRCEEIEERRLPIKNAEKPCWIDAILFIL
jgi:hypothetical protein